MNDVKAASGWDAFTVTREVQHLFEVAMDQSLEAYGMSYAQYRALEVLLASREMHVSELARRLRVTRQAARAVVEKLERVDFARLTHEAHVTYVQPTPRARKEITLLRQMADIPSLLDEGMGIWELGRLVELLTKAASLIEAPQRPYWWLDRQVVYI
jgi:DNA-binding MarR family transcriptional regulator